MIKITAEKVRAYLKQFPPEIQEEVMKGLEKELPVRLFGK